MIHVAGALRLQKVLTMKMSLHIIYAVIAKKVINANLKLEKDRIRRLMNESDIIIENFKPGTFERLLGQFQNM